MSKTISEIAQKELWVLVSQLKENIDNSELEKIAPSVLSLIDQWTGAGKFIWSANSPDFWDDVAIEIKAAS